MRTESPPTVDLVLVGGGHSHVQVLRAFGMAREPGVRVTVIAREALTPYSGMLPGFVAGRYREDELFIDLGPLCRLAGARLIIAEVAGLDLADGRVRIAGHPGFRFDWLSLNTGAVPATAGGGIDVKPIGRFVPAWRALRERARPGERIVLVGGGAGGVELALAVRTALDPAIAVTLVTDALLPDHIGAVRARFERLLAERNVALVCATARRGADGTLDTDGEPVAYDHLLWVTGVRAPAWLGASGLSVDERGFVRVDQYLRSLSHPRVFAAGDIAHLTDQERPKSGVYAVRAGPVLTDNLRRAIRHEPLRPFRAQREALALIGTGDGRAVASRGAFTVAGRWVWRWKDRIDRRFMARFTELPAMAAAPAAPAIGNAPIDPIRCGGCGAKLGADPLRRVLARLPPQRFADVLTGIGDDAALVAGSTEPLVLTTDGFRAMVDDPWRFGRIAAHHSLNDVYAMGARPTTAMALATLPLMAEPMMEEELHQMLLGAVEVLNAAGVALVGGHSGEGAELSLGLAIAGRAREPVLYKHGGRAGDALILTKPLGVGVLLAAHMRGMANTLELGVAIEAMDSSNEAAVDILRRHGVTALTDVSGFGLAGHLGEMLRASGLGATVDVAAVPALDGALRCLANGSASVLQDSNERALADFACEMRADDPRVRLLADPQTSGGLLAAIPADRAIDCVVELRASGYRASAIVGTLVNGPAQLVSGR